MATLQDVQRGYDAWAAKPHNAKWVRKIDGTPIANDIVVNIFEALNDTPPPIPHLRVKRLTKTQIETLANNIHNVNEYAYTIECLTHHLAVETAPGSHVLAGCERIPCPPACQTGSKQPEHDNRYQSASTDRTSAPVFGEHPELRHEGSRNQSDCKSDAERKDQELIKVSQDRDEVRDQIDWRQCVCGDTARDDLGNNGSPSVSGSDPQSDDLAFQPTSPFLQPVQPSVHDGSYTNEAYDWPALQVETATPTPAPRERGSE